MESQKKVMISCDSTCDLSPELRERFSIQLNPLYIVMDDRTLHDGVDVVPQDVFDFYRATGRLAKTTASNMQDFMDFFRPMVEAGYAVVHFDISASMSATYNNARLAAAEFPDVYVIDSKNLSTGAGLQVLYAADLADQGMDARSIASEIAVMREKVDASFIVDTLEYLHKGGRCSSVAALGANLLKLKPCIEVKNGSMGVGKKYRGKLEDVLLEYTANRLADLDDIDLNRVFVTHTVSDPGIVQKVVEKIRSIASFKEIFVTDAGCSVSVHCGPNTLGVLFVRKTPLQ